MNEPYNQHVLVKFNSENGNDSLDVNFDPAHETVWLTQSQIADLFEATIENVVMHLRNIINEGEIDDKATTKDFLVVRKEGNRNVKRQIKHYNLDAILSVGYLEWVVFCRVTLLRLYMNKIEAI